MYKNVYAPCSYFSVIQQKTLHGEKIVLGAMDKVNLFPGQKWNNFVSMKQMNYVSILWDK